MDIVDKIIDTRKKDLGTFINDTIDNIYIRFKSAKDFTDFMNRFYNAAIKRDVDLRIQDAYIAVSNYDLRSILYPMYLKLERYDDILSFSIIDNNYIVDKIDAKYMYDVNIYKGEEILIED